MDKHKPTTVQTESILPRPVVLKPEDLASIAAAGTAIAMAAPALTGVVIRAGGITAGPLAFA